MKLARATACEESACMCMSKLHTAATASSKPAKSCWVVLGVAVSWSCPLADSFRVPVCHSPYQLALFARFVSFTFMIHFCLG